VIGVWAIPPDTVVVATEASIRGLSAVDGS
jgi:hypothetical protein